MTPIVQRSVAPPGLGTRTGAIGSQRSHAGLCSIAPLRGLRMKRGCIMRRFMRGRDCLRPRTFSESVRT